VPDRRNVGIDADIERLETGIRQLKVQYDRFFAGVLQKPPVEMRTELERLIKRWSNAPLRSHAERFHFNALAARYNSLSELWSRTLKGMEEGDRPHPAPGDRPEPDGEHLIERCHVHDVNGERDSLKVLHSRFLAARRKAGCDGGTVGFESFLRGISSQADRLRKSSGCEEVELRLVLREGKVLLIARPGR
jgi:hypothetical protein